MMAGPLTFTKLLFSDFYFLFAPGTGMDPNHSIGILSFRVRDYFFLWFITVDIEHIVRLHVVLQVMYYFGKPAGQAKM